MHLRTHTKPESIGQAGRWQSPYHDTMIDHDKNVGTVLKALDDLGMADDTIVMYSTDNGPHMNTWRRLAASAPEQLSSASIGRLWSRTLTNC
jgi:arylsulfatase